jgi:hypothetical protein
MSQGIVSVCGWVVLLFAITVTAGCGKERDSAQRSTAGRTGTDYLMPEAPAQFSMAGRTSIDYPLLLETYGEDERDAIRIKTDPARGRLWLLGIEHVRVYDTVTKKLIRQIALPGWSVLRFACVPNLALDRSGSAFVSSNVQAKLWRIDANSFEVKEHEISLRGREEWDTGFGALAFARDGTLYALTSSLGSVWKIDVAKASASMVHLNHPPSKACAFTAQFLKDFERSQKPWTRPLPQPY